MHPIRIAALLLLTAGCYNTVPVGDAPLSGTRELVIQFTDAGSRQLSGQLGQATTQARGLFVDASPDTLHLAMIATTLSNGEEHLWNREVVGIPRNYIGTTSERVFSPAKTAGVSLIGIAAAIAVKFGFDGISGSGGGGKPPPVSQ